VKGKEFYICPRYSDMMTVVIYTVRPKRSVNGTRKKMKYKQINYIGFKRPLSFTTHCWQRSSKLLESVRKGLLNTLTFKTIPVLQNTPLATPKIKFFRGVCLILGPTKQPTIYNFYGPYSNFTLGEFVLLGRLTN
jgi:hypothetical protein